jgi:hypothetical protein
MGNRSKQLRIGLGIATVVVVAGGMAGLILLAIEMHT